MTQAVFRWSLPALLALGLLAAAAAAGMAAPGAASAQAGGAELLKGMSGVWRGRGTARKSPTAAAEPISCRYEGKLGGDGLTLALSYVCLGVEFKFESRGSLTYRPDSDSYAVSLTVAGVARRIEGSGRRRGSGLDLALVGKHPETGADLASRLTLSFSGSRKMTNVLRTTDPDTGRTFRAFSATFSR